MAIGPVFMQLPTSSGKKEAATTRVIIPKRKIRPTSAKVVALTCLDLKISTLVQAPISSKASPISDT